VNNDQFISRVQAWLSGFYMLCTFIVILLYELGWSKLETAEQQQTFGSMSNWMTGGALIVLYFWLQRARTGGIPDPTVTTTTQTTQTVTTPTDPTAPTVVPSTVVVTEKGP
jgi:hypothetical protein